MPKVTLILVTWNSAQHLNNLFAGFYNLNHSSYNWELIVVDNASHDKTLDILKTWQAKIPNFKTIIRNSRNYGFAKANNQAIQLALEQGSDYLALVNDDIVMSADWLNNIISTLKKLPQVGLAQPLITRYPYIDKINSFGNAYHFLGFGYSFGDNQQIYEFKQNKLLKDYQPAYLSFAAVVIKTEVFRQIGLLDENYFAYHEDTDFCFRARLQGWELRVVSQAVVHHNYRFPSQKNKIRYFWLEKNRLYLMLKFFKLRTWLLILPAFIFMEFGLWAYALLRLFFWQRLKAYYWLFSHLRLIRRQRHIIQSQRKYGDKKLFNFMAAEIEFQEINNPLLNYLVNPLLKIYFRLMLPFIK